MEAMYTYDPAAPDGDRKQYMVVATREEWEQVVEAIVLCQGNIKAFELVHSLAGWGIEY